MQRSRWILAGVIGLGIVALGLWLARRRPAPPPDIELDVTTSVDGQVPAPSVPLLTD